MYTKHETCFLKSGRCSFGDREVNVNYIYECIGKKIVQAEKGRMEKKLRGRLNLIPASNTYSVPQT